MDALPEEVEVELLPELELPEEPEEDELLVEVLPEELVLVLFEVVVVVLPDVVPEVVPEVRDVVGFEVDVPEMPATA